MAADPTANPAVVPAASAPPTDAAATGGLATVWNVISGDTFEVCVGVTRGQVELKRITMAGVIAPRLGLKTQQVLRGGSTHFPGHCSGGGGLVVRLVVGLVWLCMAAPMVWPVFSCIPSHILCCILSRIWSVLLGRELALQSDGQGVQE